MSSPPARETAGPGPLAGLRVIELGTLLAGPFAGRLLGDMGAEVIKVEAPGKPDPLREWGQARYRGRTLMWPVQARNKKCVTLDLRTSRGQELLLELVRVADVLTENFRPGTLERWGLGYERLSEVNAGLILARISGYGQTGPYAGRAGFASVAEAMGGLRHVTGYPDRPPTRVGVSIGDTLAGMYGVIGALMGLLARDRGRIEQGETIDVALHEAVFSVMESLLPEYTAYGVVRGRHGNEFPGVAPSNTYPCRGGDWIVIGGNADGIYHRLMEAIGRPDLAEDERFQDNTGRAAHSRMLDDVIGSWTAARSLAEVMAVMVDASVPAGPIYAAQDMLADPHFRERGVLLDADVVVDRDVERVTFPGIVPKLDQMPGEVRWLGPELGEHTAEVLAELLGVSDAELSDLRKRGVV